MKSIFVKNDQRRFRVAFDDNGEPQVDPVSDACVVLLQKDLAWTFGPSDMAVLIIDASENARHIGREWPHELVNEKTQNGEPRNWLTWSEERSGNTYRRLEARQPFARISGRGFIEGFLVRDVS